MKILSFHRFTLLIFVVFCASPLLGQSGSKSGCNIVFYNTENLFDPFDDPGTNDNEFTPKGKNHWTTEKLNHKVMMVYRALVSATNGQFPDIIGLAEIENLWILNYLIRNTPLKDGNYGIIHKESPDPRGIDVALLYRKESIVPADYFFIPVKGGINRLKSRDILCFKALWKGEKIYFLVNHWPSRSGGYMETRGKRNVAAAIAEKALDSLRTKDRTAKFLLMGDFNATPDEDCFTDFLHASVNRNAKNPNALVNLSGPWLADKKGTIRTKGRWEIFDQFICSDNLLNGKGLQISPADTKICEEPFLLEEDKRSLGKKPFRTYLGPVYHGGISDHLPVSTRIYPVR